MQSKREFEKFYQGNIDKIYRFVFFRVGNDRELAEDMVSEIFMKALKSFGQYDPSISSTAWLFTIAKNHLANYWRDRRPTELLPVDEDEVIVDKAWFLAAVQNMKKTKEKEEIYELLAKLDDDEREIVTFHYLFGYSYLEVAVIRGTTEGAVKVAAHRTIKKMQKLL